MAVPDGDGGSLDGDAAFAFQIHRIEDLLFGFARGDSVGGLKQAIGEGALAVIDVGDDAEVSDIR